MRRTALATIFTLGALVLGACTDLRDFRGQWHGSRVGTAPALTVGVGSGATAALAISALDPNGLHAQLTVDGLVTDADLTSLAGAEADALADLSFSGSPLHVYLAFVAAIDGGGPVLAIVALFDDHHVEVRLLRGGSLPLYGVFSLVEDP